MTIVPITESSVAIKQDEVISIYWHNNMMMEKQTVHQKQVAEPCIEMILF